MEAFTTFKKNHKVFSMTINIHNLFTRYRWIKILSESNLFDVAFYLSNYPDIRQNDIDPVSHYLTVGWKEGRNPSEEFNTNFYLGHYPDVKNLNSNPLIHFILFGQKEGRIPSYQELIRQSGLFDEEFYLRNYPDIRQNDIDPVSHYLTFGWKEGRNPSEEFNTNFYLGHYPDVKNLNSNPLIHFILFGQKEGRVPIPKYVTHRDFFDSNWYTNTYLALQDKVIDPFEHFIAQGIRLNYNPNEYFDSSWYREKYSELVQYDFSPLEHYLEKGWKNGFNPSPKFNTQFYLNNNPDVKQANINPFLHFVRSGQREGRVPKPIRILFVDGEPNSMSSFFRVTQIKESFDMIGFETEQMSQNNHKRDVDLQEFDIFVIFRAELTDSIRQIITLAKSSNKVLVYDCDDLLFTKNTTIADFEILKTLPKDRVEKFKQKLHDSAYIIQQSDFFTGSTSYLSDAASVYVKKSYTIRNYPPATLFDQTSISKENFPTDRFNIFYFSGSMSHQKDFTVIADALINILDKYKHVTFTVIGKFHIEEFPVLASKIGKQVFIKPYINPLEYYDRVSEYFHQAHLVVAPLDINNIMVHGKSELKFFDAGIFGIPCVASPTDTFKKIINHNHNGLLCLDSNEWISAIEKLIIDKNFYQEISANAYHDVKQHYSSSAKLQNVIDVYTDIIQRYPYLNQLLHKKRNDFLPAIYANERSHKKDLLIPSNLYEESKQLPSIDISIVLYFSSRWLESCLFSLKNQSYNLKLLNIYLMDHSEDKQELERLKQIIQGFRDTFGSIQIESEHNLGFGAGHNKNFEISSSEYILVLNCDLILHADALDILARQAMNDPSDVASWEARQLPYEHPKFYDPTTMHTAWSSAACVLIRKSVIQEIGGFDDRIFMYCEDVELSFRFRDHGYNLKYTPKAIAYHFTYEDTMFKPLQAVGSLLGHFYIRLRYGTEADIAAIKSFYKAKRRQFRGKIDYQGELYKKHVALFRKNAAYFLKTKKVSDKVFPFFDQLHEVPRDGAFIYSLGMENFTAPLVSVIIRIHGENNDSFLNEAIISVLNQTYPNIEIVVVEDRDTIYASYCDKLRTNGVNITYVSNNSGGRNRSGNLGLENAKGDFFMFLDFDDLLFADHIETLASSLLNSKNASAAVGGSWAVFTRYHENSYTETGYIRFNATLTSITHEALCKRNLMPIQAVLFSRELFDTLGGFDEELPGFEDWELWLRYSKSEEFLIVQKTTSIFRLRDISYHNIDKQQRQQSALELMKKKYNIG